MEVYFIIIFLGLMVIGTVKGSPKDPMMLREKDNSVENVCRKLK